MLRCGCGGEEISNRYSTTYSGVSSGLSGNSLKQVAKDTLTGGLTGAVAGGTMGGLAYGADKALGTLNNLIKGSPKPEPGHITEMATRNLNSADDVEIPLLEDKRAGQLLLEDKHAGQPLLEDKRAGQLPMCMERVYPPNVLPCFPVRI